MRSPPTQTSRRRTSGGVTGSTARASEPAPARRRRGTAQGVREVGGGRAAEEALFRGVVASPDEPLHELYKRADYRFIRHSLEMRLELDADDLPDPQWPEGIRVRAFDPAEDEQAAYETSMEAFEDHWEFVREPFDEWRGLIVVTRALTPRSGFCEDGGQIAGCCLGGVHSTGDRSFGYVFSLAVRRPWRKRGLGLALLHDAFREFHNRGMTRAGLEVDAENLTGAVRLYERADMHIVKRQDIYEKALSIVGEASAPS